MYRYLGQHPAIFMAKHKEPHFFAFEGHPPSFQGIGDAPFNQEVITTRDAYESLFRGSESARYRGEASTMYMYLPTARQRLAQYCPDAHLIVMLRNPVDRAHSSYWFQRRRGYEPLESFEQALAAEPQRRAQNWLPIWHYTAAGFYTEQVRPLLERFGRERVHIVLQEHFDDRPAEVLAQLFAWLGLPTTGAVDHSIRHNQSGMPRSKLVDRLLERRRWKRPAKAVLPVGVVRQLERWREHNLQRADPLPPALRRQLAQQFAADVRRLQDLIERDLSAWLL